VGVTSLAVGVGYAPLLHLKHIMLLVVRCYHLMCCILCCIYYTKFSVRGPYNCRSYSKGSAAIAKLQSIIGTSTQQDGWLSTSSWIPKTIPCITRNEAVKLLHMHNCQHSCGVHQPFTVMSCLVETSLLSHLPNSHLALPVPSTAYAAQISCCWYDSHVPFGRFISAAMCSWMHSLNTLRESAKSIVFNPRSRDRSGNPRYPSVQ
jgi:hypothetical protein